MIYLNILRLKEDLLDIYKFSLMFVVHLTCKTSDSLLLGV